MPITDFTEDVPITSADAIAAKLVTAAGPSGAVVLNFSPPEAVLILQAAQALNLEDRVKYWACSTECNTDFLATALGPKWNGKLFVNAELTPLDNNNSATASRTTWTTRSHQPTGSCSRRRDARPFPAPTLRSPRTGLSQAPRQRCPDEYGDGMGCMGSTDRRLAAVPRLP